MNNKEKPINSNPIPVTGKGIFTKIAEKRAREDGQNKWRERLGRDVDISSLTFDKWEYPENKKGKVAKALSFYKPAHGTVDEPEDSPLPDKEFDFADEHQTILKKYLGKGDDDGEVRNIPDTVTKIAKEAFEGKAITYIDLSGVDEIEEYAFKNCTSLVDVKFKEGVSIGKSAFAYCTSLKNLSFPKSVKIFDKAFESCTALDELSFDGEDSYVIGKEVFPRNHNSFGKYAPEIKGVLYEYKPLDRNSGKMELVKFLGHASDITIPDAVTKIGIGAFMDSPYIKSVKLNNVTEIEHHAFDSCKELNRVEFDSVTKVGVSAFEDCVKLNKIEFEKEVELKEASFYQCTGLTEVYFRQPPIIGDSVFERCTSLDIVESRKGFIKIGESAFDKCKALTQIGDEKGNLTGVTSIGDSAFRKCESLKKLVLPKTITKIGESVFTSCIALDGIHISFQMDAKFHENGDWACNRPVYDEKGGIVHERVEEVTEHNYDKIFDLTAPNDNGDFENPNNPDEILDATKSFITNRNKNILIKYIGTIAEVELPDTIFHVGDEAFMYRNDITSVSAKKLTQIGNYAFSGCEKLERVPFENVVNVGHSAFEDCHALRTITFPKDVVIQSAAFFSCEYLREVIFEGRVSRIEYAAFGRCKNLTNVDFKKECFRIGSNVFEKCKELHTVTEPAGLKSLGFFVFRKCKELRKFILPDTIGPNGLTEKQAKDMEEDGMGDNVFFGCDRVKIEHRGPIGNWPPNWDGGHNPRPASRG